MYSIMRTVKHKITGGGLKASLEHLYRERETLNADSSVNNLSWKSDGPQTSSVSMEKLRAVVDRVSSESGRKVRKDAVVAVEYLMTASPDYFSQFTDPTEHQKKVVEFSKLARDWVQKQYPDGTVIAAQIHLDETTPHVSLFITPTFKNADGRLSFSAKSVLGGRQKLSEHQDSFAKVFEPLGLKRGVKGSKIKHDKVSRFYAQVVNSITDLENIYTEDVYKIDALSKKFGSKGDLAEFAKELSHDNLKLRHSIRNQDTAKRIEVVKAAHLVEISDIEKRHKAFVSSLRQELERLNKEADGLLESGSAASKERDRLKHEVGQLREALEVSARDAIMRDHYDSILTSAFNERGSKEVLEFLNHVRGEYIDRCIGDDLIKYRDLKQADRDLYDQRSGAAYTPRMR